MLFSNRSKSELEKILARDILDLQFLESMLKRSRDLDNKEGMKAYSSEIRKMKERINEAQDRLAQKKAA